MKNAGAVAGKIIINLSISFLMFWATGFAIGFGNGNNFMGSAGWFLDAGDAPGDSLSLGLAAFTGADYGIPVEAFFFFVGVPPVQFFTGTRWSASILPYAFGVIPLITSTLLIAFIALVLAVPLGILAAVWMSEFASQRSTNSLRTTGYQIDPALTKYRYRPIRVGMDGC